MAAKLNYNQIIIDASNRFHAIVNACMNSKDYSTIAGLTCSSLYSCEKNIPAVKEEKEHPVLDLDLCFNYRGYSFELSSCNSITRTAQIVGLTHENFRERFPHGIFSDRYVCWMNGHKDFDGLTYEESDDPECWSPKVYLVDWMCGATFDLIPGHEVEETMLDKIDKFLETFKE